MANDKSIILKFSILLIVVVAFEVGDAVTVIIKNDISPYPKPTELTVHCKSKNDDLGFHNLAFGETYMFSFRPLVFPPTANTLFFCSFTWPRNPYRHYLDIYDQAKDDCQTCNWRISKTGGCKSSKEDPEFCQNWKSIE
ncbi:unnamed protein product [Lathyrus oleraceus]|uniref:S-protein homolog 5-like n=1 Tax=Pisum sativum TaxID=3888 RepID=UPI0021D00DC0|nr:S-protein homolog 5-like [Pisum sativum]